MPNACLAAMLLDLSFCCPPLPGSTTLTPPVHQAHAGAAMQTRVSWMSGARGMRFWSQHCFNALASILPSTALPGSVRRTATAYQNNFFSIDGSKASRAFFFWGRATTSANNIEAVIRWCAHARTCKGVLTSYGLFGLLSLHFLSFWPFGLSFPFIRAF